METKNYTIFFNFLPPGGGDSAPFPTPILDIMGVKNYTRFLNFLPPGESKFLCPKHLLDMCFENGLKTSTLFQNDS